MFDDDEYENKPISLITDEERVEDAENQRRLLQAFYEVGYYEKSTAIFERIDPRFSIESPVRAILSFCLSNDNEIGALQISNPYLGTYAQRFHYHWINRKRVWL